MDKKAWYKSKGVWTGIVTIGIALYSLAIKIGYGFPPIYEEVYIILGVLGIYARSSAKTKIGK